MTAAPAVSLPWFEGPLDLLLDLVHRNNIDISDLPIAEITRQYLDYMERAEQLDIELGADFTYTAALLIHIKSQCLLARDPEIAAREEDPRHQLARQLFEHQQLHHTAELLGDMLDAGGNTWTRSSITDFAPASEPVEPAGPMNALQVLRLARKALETARAHKVVNPRDGVTVRDMVLWLIRHIQDIPAALDALALLQAQSDPDHRSALFLAMLELTKQSRIRLEQNDCFGPVLLTRLPGAGGQLSI